MIKSRDVFRALLCAMLCIPLSACGEPTVGQQFRDIIAEIDAKCKKEKLGPYLDPNEPQRSDKRTNSSCDILKLKPADPLATEEGRFAYSIKLPPPHDKPKVEYRKGMSAESYFKALCEKEAGEWIFKTVEGVEGVFQGRRMEPFSAGYSNLVFFTREFLDGLASEETMVQPSQGRYNYFERPTEKNEGDSTHIRFYRGAENKSKYKAGYPQVKNGRWSYMPYIVNNERTDSFKSRYGYTSRQIAKKDEIENGIVGSELIIYDRTTNEVFAFRRSFIRYWPRPDSKNTRLTNVEGCQPNFTKAWPQFIEKVLVPINPAE